MALSAKLLAQVTATQTTVLDLGTGTLPLTKRELVELTNGTTAGKADKMFSDTRTINASSSEDLDLAGVLTDAFGATITLTRVKAIMVKASSANSNNVVVGNASSNAWATLLGATHTVTLRPGSTLMVIAGSADATGYAVTAGTGDILKVANSGAGTSVSYDIIIIGASA